jgi:hypothetical protein
MKAANADAQSVPSRGSGWISEHRDPRLLLCFQIRVIRVYRRLIFLPDDLAILTFLCQIQSAITIHNLELLINASNNG